MRRRVILLLLIVLAVVVYWRVRHPARTLGAAYVGDRVEILWDSTAVVRSRVATLHYGDQVTVIELQETNAHVRTTRGLRGWLDASALIEPGPWQRAQKLVEDSRAAPVQAEGETKVTSNLRVEPGRNTPRIYQFPAGVRLDVLSRAVAPAPAAAQSTPPRTSAAGQPAEENPNREDWLLVRGAVGASRPAGVSAAPAESADETPVVGWMLARFLKLLPPQPVHDLASSSGMRVIGWLALNQVSTPSGEVPQYLAFGVRGGEGQSCDFTLLRVYTWSTKRRRYETAFLDSNFCGYLPVRVSQTPAGDTEFRFTALESKGGPDPMNRRRAQRLYRMRQTLVRRIP